MRNKQQRQAKCKQKEIIKKNKILNNKVQNDLKTITTTTKRTCTFRIYKRQERYKNHFLGKKLKKSLSVCTSVYISK